MHHADDLQRRISAVAMFLAPVLLLVSEVLRYEAPPELYFWSGVTAILGMALLIHVVLGLRHLLRVRSPRMAAYGCGLALLLSVSGPAIITVYLVSWTRLPDSAAAEAITEAAFIRLFPMMFLPGVLYLWTRAVVGARLSMVGAVPRWVGWCMAAGYFLIPLGRIPGIPPLVYVASLLILMSEGWTGWWILRTPSAWTHGAAGEREPAARLSPA